MSNDIQSKIFPNGLKLIHQSVGHSHPISSIFVFIRFGSIDEIDVKTKGIAHFIEHMCFKGTKQRKDSIDIVSAYDEIGAYLNAETHKQYTCYKVKCMDKYVAHSIRVLSDMILHSTFKKKEVDLERHVVIEENIRADDDPTTHIDNAIYKILYANTPYSDPIDDISFHHNANSLALPEILSNYRKFYQPQYIGISVVSNLSFATVKKAISNSAFMTPGPRCPAITTRSLQLLPTIQTPKIIIMKKPGINATHISIAFRTCEHGHKDQYALYLIQNILGGYMSSRLFMILREKHGLTYTSSCHSLHHAISGHFELRTMCDPTKLLKSRQTPGVLSLLVEILNDLLADGITQKELNDVKGNFQGKHLLDMEKSDTKCSYNGIEYILYDKPEIVPYESLYSTFFERITKKNILDIARKYFRPENMIISLVGEHVPTEDVVARYFSKMSGWNNMRL